MSIRFVNRTSANEFETGHCFQALNLLAHAQLIELSLGSQCGGKARCGKDRVWIAETDRKQLNSPHPSERALLGDEAVDSGWRLACQAFPSRDDLDLTVYLGE